MHPRYSGCAGGSKRSEGSPLPFAVALPVTLTAERHMVVNLRLRKAVAEQLAQWLTR